MNKPYDYEDEGSEDQANPHGIPRPMPKEEGPKRQPKPAAPKPKDNAEVREDPDPTPAKGIPRPHMRGAQFWNGNE